MIEGRILFKGRAGKEPQPGFAYGSASGGISAGRRYESDGYAVFMEGIIYSARGARIDRDCPEKTVLRLYREQKDSFTRMLDGDFIIVIMEAGTGALKIFNNRFQAATLFYSMDDSAFYFSSSLARLAGMLPSRPGIDPWFIPTFLSTGCNPTERTAFRGIFQMLPAQSISIDNGKASISDSWKDELRFERRKIADPQKAADEYEALFSAGIGEYLEAARPGRLGMLLSGGQDTGYSYIEASRLYHGKMHAFTASFEGWGFDEFPKARYFTEKFGGTIHNVIIGPRHIDLVPSLVLAAESPVSGGSIPVHACAHEAKRYADALITGDGGDTLWGEFYPVAEWHRYISRLPLPARIAMHLLSEGMLKISDWERLWEIEHVLSLFSRKDIYKGFYRRLCTYRHYNEHMLRKLLSRKLYPEIRYNDCRVEIGFTRKNMYDALIEAKLLYGVYLYMNIPTHKSIRSAGLGFYTPYYNSRLIRFITSLPQEWVNGGSAFQKLTNDAVKRRLHKLAMKKYLPDRMVYGLQQSLDVPWHILLGRRPKALDRLLSRLKRRGWFEGSELDRIFAEFRSQRPKPQELWELKNHGYRIYTLLTLEVWCMIYLDSIMPKEGLSLEEYLK